MVASVEGADSLDTKTKILETIRKNPRGMTIKQIGEGLELSRETVTKHVKSLEYENEVYTVRFGNAEVFCGNHRKYRDKDTIRLNFGSRTLFINRLENDFGEFIKISETRKKENKWEQKGSILVSPENLNDLIDALKEVEQRPKQVQAES